jgi:hypothetical protein
MRIEIPDFQLRRRDKALALTPVGPRRACPAGPCDASIYRNSANLMWRMVHLCLNSQTEGPFTLMSFFHKLKIHSWKANDSAWVVCHCQGKKQMACLWSFLGGKRWDERKQCEHRVLNPKWKWYKGMVEWRRGVLNQIMLLQALPIQPGLLKEIPSV